MQPWEQALDRFLAPWRARDNVSAALVYGSRVDGSASDDSDLDVLVVTRDDDTIPPVLCRLDGVLIEAFFHTPSRLRAAFEQHHRENSRVTPVQWVTGRILFDRDGSAAALKEEARRWLEKPFSLPGEVQRYWMKRSLWQGVEHLRKIHRQGGAEFAFVAQQHLHKVYVTYAKCLGQPVNDPHRVYRAFTDAEFRRRFMQPEFPDAAFAAGFVAAVETVDRDALMALAAGLSEHVLQHTGGFDVGACE